MLVKYVNIFCLKMQCHLFFSINPEVSLKAQLNTHCHEMSLLLDIRHLEPLRQLRRVGMRTEGTVLKILGWVYGIIMPSILII